jgi:hypothetical protein
VWQSFVTAKAIAPHLIAVQVKWDSSGAVLISLGFVIHIYVIQNRVHRKAAKIAKGVIRVVIQS